MVSQFDTEDTVYLQWMHDHPQGFVVNTERSAGSRLAVLHWAQCSHITVTKSLQPGAFTARDYIKLCSEDAQDLQVWIHENRPNARISYCQTCKPPEFLEFIYPDETDEEVDLWEGAKKAVKVNAYERNPKARQKCIEYYGVQCIVCGFDFGIIHGEIGQNFIHVHHVVPLSVIDQHYQIDPIQDLRPVCPNCHAMLHKRPKQPYTIEELKGIIQYQQKNNR